ncbi:MAG: hypothetical protein ABFC39_12740 [Proteiniphilum sp.]
MIQRTMGITVAALIFCQFLSAQQTAIRTGRRHLGHAESVERNQ